MEYDIIESTMGRNRASPFNQAENPTRILVRARDSDGGRQEPLAVLVSLGTAAYESSHQKKFRFSPNLHNVPSSILPHEVLPHLVYDRPRTLWERLSGNDGRVIVGIDMGEVHGIQVGFTAKPGDTEGTFIADTERFIPSTLIYRANSAYESIRKQLKKAYTK